MPSEARSVVLGARGQLGTDLCRRLGAAAVGLDLPEFDATCERQVADAFQRLRPEVVINCVAQTNVDQCEREAEQAFAANALTALHVARQAERCGAAVVFISTDYVFGGPCGTGWEPLPQAIEGAPRGGPYTEADAPTPVNVYGATKLAGEHLTSAYNPRSYIVRTSGLYGHAGARGKGGNFVETMLRLAAEATTAKRGRAAPQAAESRRAIRVVNDQRLSPTSTLVLADRLAALMRTGRYGLYHIAAADSCTWYEFARAVLQHADFAGDVRPIPSSEYPLPARRPACSALGTVRLPAANVPLCPTWREMLAEYMQNRHTPVGAA
ncbi:MAG: dTDP-4-dehydrorhamnose reductase [Planctomycetota bacterium]